MCRCLQMIGLIDLHVYSPVRSQRNNGLIMYNMLRTYTWDMFVIFNIFDFNRQCDNSIDFQEINVYQNYLCHILFCSKTYVFL